METFGTTLVAQSPVTGFIAHSAIGRRMAHRLPNCSFRVIVCAAALTISLALPALADNPGDALVQTKGAVDQAIQVLRNKQLSLTEKRRELRDMAEANFDFADMSRSALGYHCRELSPDQRQEFSKLFSAFIEDAYLDRIQEYSSQDVEFVDQRSDGPDLVSVNSKLAGGNSDDPIALDFRLKREANGWKIYVEKWHAAFGRHSSRPFDLQGELKSESRWKSEWVVSVTFRNSQSESRR